MQILLSNTCDLFSRKFVVFNEMEMEININNKILTKTTWKNRSIDYNKSEYLPDKNSNSNETKLFLRKTDETI